VDFLGIGPLELMFVILIALIVIGPKDMSKTARSAGRYLNRMYRSETWRAVTQASRTLQTLPNRLAREAQLEELDEVRKDLDKTTSALKAGTGNNPVLEPWITPYNTPEQFKGFAPSKPGGSAVSKTTTPTPADRSAPAKAAKPPTLEKSASTKPSKATGQPASTTKKKSTSPKGKTGSTGRKTKPPGPGKSSSRGRPSSSRSKPTKKSGG
jgi:Sec-independent protein translocase protein TatA